MPAEKGLSNVFKLEFGEKMYNIKENVRFCQWLCILGSVTMLYNVELVFAANEYTTGAHGNSPDGVNRTSMTGYSAGNCAHCHEQHASVNGSEPDPTAGTPSPDALFDDYTSQTVGFCLRCHTDSSSYQDGGIVNRSYSYRAGNYSADTLNDIEEAFSSSGSSHNLDDIQTFITDAGQSDWGYNSESNPCVACHNPHEAQGDPFNSPDTAKTIATRGYPVSLPSLHDDATTWGLWGEAGEKMSDYTTNYQAPYRMGSAVFEPDGSATEDGSNLTDFATFCTDCHNTTNVIYSSNLGRDLKKINWTGTDLGALGADIHGQKKGRDATYDKGTIKAPYNDASVSDYTLSCLDCHEPHGSPNAFLLRREVNGVVISVPIHTTNDNGGWTDFCLACHDVTNTANGACSTAHGPPSWPLTRACQGCHNHGQYNCAGFNSSF